MKIEFSKSEYRTLIELLYLAEWVLIAHDEEPDPKKERYYLLCQKLYASAKAMGCENLIEYAKELRAFAPTQKLEELASIRETIESYNAETFWEELIDRLIERDIAAQLPTLTKEPETPEEYDLLASPLVEKYTTEFGTNGIRRLKLEGA